MMNSSHCLKVCCIPILLHCSAHSQEANPMERNSAEPGAQYQQSHFSLLTLPQCTGMKLQGKSSATPALTSLVNRSQLSSFCDGLSGSHPFIQFAASSFHSLTSFAYEQCTKQSLGLGSRGYLRLFSENKGSWENPNALNADY